MIERDRDKDLRPYAAGIAASERTRTYLQRVEETCPDSSDAPLMGGPIRVYSEVLFERQRVYRSLVNAADHGADRKGLPGFGQTNTVQWIPSVSAFPRNDKLELRSLGMTN